MTTAMDRELAIELLRCMGVDLPPKTKLPKAELDKRLSKTLDGVQYLARVVPTIPLNPALYKPWHLDKSNKLVFDAVQRHNVGESSYIYDMRQAGNHNPYPLYVNPFMDLRQSIMTVGKHLDEGRDTMSFADKEQTTCIFLRVMEVLEFDKQTPILMVLFRRELRGIQPSESMVKWIVHQSEGRPNGKGMPQIFATAKEQHLFIRLLERNSERLPATYKPQRTATERDFVPSFILPVGPLGGKEVAKFNSNDGCSVCGEPAKSKCSRCNVKRYCGATCQKEDWKAHRPTCTSLKGAKWQTAPFITRDTYIKAACPPGAIPVHMNRYDSVQLRFTGNDEEANEDDPNTPPPNIHGSTPFIVKVQLNSADVHMMVDATLAPGQKVAQTGLSILIYDRKRSFEVCMTKYICPAAAFDPIAALVRERGRNGGLKTFLWATRTGEWTLDLCIDQFPEWQQW